jgi:hypothetical protein
MKIVTTTYYLLFSLSTIIVMLLMMTMNGYVEIFIAFGLAFGYFIFESSNELKF